MTDHISKVCQISFLQLRQLRRVRRYLPQEAALKLAHAFVSCRLDYCNSVLFGLRLYLIARLQSVLNSSARLATRTSRFVHITPVLRELHWLPYPQRITFKICLTVYKCLHGMAPHYLSSVCIRLDDLLDEVVFDLPVVGSCLSPARKRRNVETAVFALVAHACGTPFPLNYEILV